MLIKRKLRQNSTLTLRLITGNWLLFASLLIDMYMYAVVCSVRGTSCTIDVGCFTLNVKQRQSLEICISTSQTHGQCRIPLVIMGFLCEILSIWWITHALFRLGPPHPLNLNPANRTTNGNVKVACFHKTEKFRGFSWNRRNVTVPTLVSWFLYSSIQNPVYMHHIYHL